MSDHYAFFQSHEAPANQPNRRIPLLAISAESQSATFESNQTASGISCIHQRQPDLRSLQSQIHVAEMNIKDSSCDNLIAATIHLSSCKERK
ncbi:unnamed protein product, partial [Mesorhabditis belari]|uniref:Uncharacterized protein n=1 Tax=Mesorhabditis belari TaxID=2138241 RepID=A0AAF3EKW7_9BILA